MKRFMKYLSLIFLMLCLLNVTAQENQNIPKLFEQWEPVPKVIDPGDHSTAPSDAIVLFDGSNLDAWENAQGGPAEWLVEDGIVTVVAGKGIIRSKESFGNCQLHIEWRTPAEVKGDGQGRGNSGIFLQSRYELQVLDSYNNSTYPNGQAASIYKQHIPLVNASRGPGQWQSYDIIYTAPKFNELGYRISPGRMTVLHNGVLVQNDVVLYGTTEYSRAPQNEPHGNAPITLQDHGNPVSFRNIWIRPL